MHDYWNDPPETHEAPECCGEEMTVDEQGNCRCETCGKTIAHQPDIEPPIVNEEPGDFEPLEPAECPHGRAWGECAACDHVSDIAFDTARERRLFR